MPLQLLKLMNSMFFAPLDVYEPAGMFTTQHIMSLIICLILVSLALIATKNMKWQTVLLITKVMAIVMTCLEAIKIGYNFYYGYTCLDAWLPLSFCSLFIYALWLSGYGKGFLKNIGDAYIVIGCFLGGLGFLLFPTTLLMRYPIWHYLCLYSLFFHVAMIYLGVMYIKHHRTPINRKTFMYFSLYFMIFAIISMALNVIYGSNIMILREPFNVPFKFIHVIKAKSQIAYTLLATTAYLVGPGLFALIISRILIKKNEKTLKSDST